MDQVAGAVLPILKMQAFTSLILTLALAGLAHLAVSKMPRAPTYSRLKLDDSKPLRRAPRGPRRVR